MNEIVCPNCGEDEYLKGDSKESRNAEKVTVAFWIKATKTGTNILQVEEA